eukprot:GHVO01033523.1.p1 GENE.GHVO01033523.1~~GHVO01033523.1.p1  ORF type:complete len:257 (-),score=43.85 GHVO01033523.1:35-724(-)
MLIKSDTRQDLDEAHEQALLAKTKTFRMNGWSLRPYSFACRRSHLLGVLRALPPPPTNPLEALTKGNKDPSAMFGPMKNQFAYFALNGGLAYLIGALFSGFIVAKTPFPLPYKFKSMLQRGVDVPNLDVTYVSSVSWYFVCLFGSTGLMTIIQALQGGDDQFDNDAATMQMLGMGMMAGGQSPMGGMLGGSQRAGEFKKEIENLGIAGRGSRLDCADGDLARYWGLETS